MQTVVGGGGMNELATASQPQAAYDARLRRVMDAVQLKTPDRVPVGMMSILWWARYGGTTVREIMYDGDLLARIAMQALEEFEPDVFQPPHMTAYIGRMLEAAGFKQMLWSGHGVGDHQGYQYLDREYMSAAEYDDFLFDPTGFFLQTYLPRVATAFEGLAHLPWLPSRAYFPFLVGMASFADPRVQASLAQLRNTGEEAVRLLTRSAQFIEDAKARGFPADAGVICFCPFDMFGDYMRGAKGILTDMYRHPDKLLEATDKAAVMIAREAIKAARMSGSPFVFIPIHWGPDNFMSLKNFQRFWWPGLRKVMMSLIEADLIPIVLWEANCASRLETIADIPPGKAIYHFEQTDMRLARDVLRGVVCIRGNVPASIMVTGQPEDVDAYCRGLIEDVGRGGGFILDGALGIPDDAPLRNVRALYEAARKYGG